MSVSLTFTTLGELIKRKRVDKGLSLSELGRMTGISKGVLSKIESGETKRPELRTLKPIADALEIPYEEIIECYVEIESRIEVLNDILQLCIEVSSSSLTTKVATKFLENSKEETYVLLEQVYNLANKAVNNEVRLSLYNTIIKYARAHGIPMYIAKPSFQKYLIERQDLKNMEESFKIGEEVVHYSDFLTEEERIILYFRMALQAYAIKKYEICIELCQAGITLEKKDTELKARAYLAMINSYSDLGDYSTVELHLEIFKGFKHNFVAEATKLESAIVKSKKKEYDQAILLLKESLQNISEHARIHVVNELLEIYFELEDVDAVSEIFANEKSLLFSTSTPYKLISLGRYYLFKGNYQVSIGLFEDGIISYTESLKAYGEVNAYQEIVKCMNEILSNHSLLSESELLFEKLKKVYNGIVDNIN